MLVESLGPRLVEGLGMTENSGGLIAATRASDYINPRPDIFESTGIAAPDTIVDIIDEDGNLLPHDGEAVGQLVAHSGSLARGYWGNPEATAKSFVNGWYNTGDLGRMTPDGYIYMIDRRNDLISSGGMNVYPSEIERVILTVPGVTLCAVVAAPHEKWGQTPVAFVISNNDSLTTDAIKEVCKKELANYKLPSEIRIVKQVPTNTSGKILKHELRDQLENEKKTQ
jgi:acyl-CoA synthetase (AMP-forming)/AMP-acid ligase II